jgi:hypothetical protein
MRFLDIAIECFQIEFKLTKIFRLKFIDFEFKCNQALKFTIEEKQVNGEIAVPNLQTVLLSQKGEVSPKFKNEVS